MKPHRSENLIAVDQISFSSQTAVIRDEGRRIRSTMWTVAFVIMGCVVFAPLLYAAAPVLTVLLGSCFIAALVGALLGKLISRRRTRNLMREIRSHNDRVVSIRSGSRAKRED